ncbi:MAG: flippase-like domain-containing protein, partial [candidate division KSB1 bacterium]|nr:flippase-like domain-containing protein [candidate division KSB1 bacterium]
DEGDNNKMNWGKKIHFVTLAVFIILLTLVLSRMDLGKSWDALTGVEWGGVICVMLLNILNTGVEAVRWRLILLSVKKGVRVYNTFTAILVGVVGNIILPFRIGDGARTYFLAREEKIDLASSFSTVVLDRIADIAIFLMLVALTTFFFPFPLSIKRTGLLAGGAFVVVVFVLITLMRLSQSLGSKFRGKLGRRVSNSISRFTRSLSALRHSGRLLSISLLSAFSWLVKLAMVHAMFRAFHLTLPLIAGAVVLVFVNLGISIANTPANLGGFELSTVAALKLFSVDIELAVSYAITLHLVEVIPTLLMGLVVLWFTGFKSSKLPGHTTTADPSEPLEVNY